MDTKRGQQGHCRGGCLAVTSARRRVARCKGVHATWVLCLGRLDACSRTDGSLRMSPIYHVQGGGCGGGQGVPGVAAAAGEGQQQQPGLSGGGLLTAAQRDMQPASRRQS